ncbi:MAG TPA: ROK family protein [Abditibacteriaceae bacterium]|jgi:predicted NBD/HSP70 family sugar kinase
MPVYIGLDIGGTKFMAAAADAHGNILRRTRHDTPLELDAGLSLLHDMTREVAQGEEIVAFGASAGGPMDQVRGIISPLHQPQWRDVPIKHIFEEKYGVPFRVEVDTDAAALAEWQSGGDHAVRLLYVTLSTGCGAGFLIDGEIYRGANGVHPEYAHCGVARFPSTRNAPILCECGAHDCLTALVSGNGIRHLYACAAEQLSDEQWHEVAFHLGQGLRNWASILAPDVIVLGGGVAIGGGETLLNEARRVMQENVRLTPVPQVRLSNLGYDTALRGAVVLAMQSTDAQSLFQ